MMLFVARYWKPIAGGMAALSILCALWLLQAQRDEARQRFEIAQAKRAETDAKLAISNASLVALQVDIDKQNGAIQALGVEGEKRRAEAVANLVAEVKRGSKAAVVAATLGAKPQTGGAQERTSATVLENRNLL